MKTVITKTGKRYKLITTYNNEFHHYKCIDSRGKIRLIARCDIKTII